MARNAVIGRRISKCHEGDQREPGNFGKSRYVDNSLLMRMSITLIVTL